MHATGIIVKMPVRHIADVQEDQPNIAYTLRLEERRAHVGQWPVPATQILLNRYVGHTIRLEHNGAYTCIRCGRSVRKLYGEGYCYPCFESAPEAAECIVRPELCRAHLGEGRDPAWENEHHNQPHAVYLAITSAIKVGVTRSTQIPTRWIDQGAAWAVQIADLPYRQLAGRIEVALKELYTDRTAWQRMLKGETLSGVDLSVEMERVTKHLSGVDPALVPHLLPVSNLNGLTLRYPIQEPPAKVRSINLRTSPLIESTLLGIRGQYLIFEGGRVLNMRRHSGFHLEVTAKSLP